MGAIDASTRELGRGVAGDLDDVIRAVAPAMLGGVRGGEPLGRQEASDATGGSWSRVADVTLRGAAFSPRE
jgi:hypothetical protein